MANPEHDPEDFELPQHPGLDAPMVTLPPFSEMTDAQLADTIDRVEAELQDMHDMDIAIMLDDGPGSIDLLEFMVDSLRDEAHRQTVAEIVYTQFNGDKRAFMLTLLEDMILDPSIRLSDTRVWKSQLGVR